MAQRPEFLEFDVGGATLGALSWTGLVGTPTIVALHGITANAWAWDPVAHHLAGGARVVAIDLRGRGRSFTAPPPFGIRQHADDVAAVIDQLGAPALVAGHSMGAIVALLAAERHPEAVGDVVLVDGGPPLPLPNGDDIDAALEHALGPAIARLRTIWPDRVSYHAMWAQHPAFVDGIGPDLERNLLADLIEVDGGFRTAVDETAVRVDGAELLSDREIRMSLDRRSPPATIIRAEFGMMGAPPPLITPTVRDQYPEHHWVEGRGLNHYTVLSSPSGAGLVADALRRSLTTSS